ncbi:hypothetical protein MVEN_01985200 [Mycena venus]|uniref:Uncharacterized protein n=1 Tax=Mycena venus TaxID=2733690 RepID=A0A8H7CKW5_9AGAR|nr:hypothetical protein MVEN_01985200 [Mycena venus]
MQAPRDKASVEEWQEELHTRFEAPQFRKGVLCAVDNEDPLLVDVPMYHGVPYNDVVVRDLWVHAWVPTNDTGITDLRACMAVVAAYQDVVLEHPYTIVYYPPSSFHTTPKKRVINATVADFEEALAVAKWAISTGLLVGYRHVVATLPA